MASTKFIIVLAIVAIVYPSITAATEYTVGDESGWTGKYDYEAWAKDKMFNVGDKLVFNYDPTKHNVYKVNATGFNDCVVPSGVEALKSGKDVITLASPGRKWYICGKPNHCGGLGMRLRISVMDMGAPAPSPTTNSASGIMTLGFQIIATGLVAIVAIISA